MLPIPQLPADLVTFTEETLNGKLHHLPDYKKMECLFIDPSSLLEVVIRVLNKLNKEINRSGHCLAC